MLQLREANPMKRVGRPEEVAKAVAFLAFEATFTTGAELAVDGGASRLRGGPANRTSTCAAS